MAFSEALGTQILVPKKTSVMFSKNEGFLGQTPWSLRKEGVERQDRPRDSSLDEESSRRLEDGAADC